MRPVPLPFAGRPLNLRGCHQFLAGEGNVRELQGTVWLFMAHLFAEDVVGPKRHPNALAWVEEAGLSRELVEGWIADAINDKRARTAGHADVDAIDPMEFSLMRWHPVRVLQQQTRVKHSPMHESFRQWSLKKRREFLADGGEFSPTEVLTRSPLGPDRVPWMDPARFFSPNYSHPLIRSICAERMPLRTGVSGVAMHIVNFGNVLQIRDAAGLRIAAAGYLLSLYAHSFAEIAIGMRYSGVCSPCDAEFGYQALADIDWADVGNTFGMP